MNLLLVQQFYTVLQFFVACQMFATITPTSKMYILSRVDWGTNGLTRFMAPIAEAIF